MKNILSKGMFLILGTGFIFYYYILAILIASHNAESNPFIAIVLLLGGFLEPFIFLLIGAFYLFYFFSPYHAIEKIQKSLLPVGIASIFSLPFLLALSLPYLDNFMRVSNLPITESARNIFEALYVFGVAASLYGSHIVVAAAGFVALSDNVQGWRGITKLRNEEKKLTGNKEFYKKALKKWRKQLFISFIFFVGSSVVIGIVKSYISDSVYDGLIKIFSPIFGWVLVSCIFLIISAMRYSMAKNKNLVS